MVRSTPRFMVMLVVICLLAGCGEGQKTGAKPGAPAPGAQPGGPGPAIPPATLPASPPATPPAILLGRDKMPKEALQWIESQTRTRQVVRKTFGTWDVYVVAMGEQRTGGYAVKIENAGFDSGKTWIIDVKFIEPAPGQMVTQALTYPYEAFAVPKGVPTKVRLIDKNGQPTELQIKAG